MSASGPAAPKVDDSPLTVVLTTVDSTETAARIARTLVEQRLAACVQISPIQSVYRWEGEVHSDPELRLLIKTTRARYPALAEALGAMHPYALPVIMALPVKEVPPDVADWVRAETAPLPDDGAR
jgi:periplasmic divalent cation tolerance protein